MVGLVPKPVVGLVAGLGLRPGGRTSGRTCRSARGRTSGMTSQCGRASWGDSRSASGRAGGRTSGQKSDFVFLLKFVIILYWNYC